MIAKLIVRINGERLRTLAIEESGGMLFLREIGGGIGGGLEQAPALASEVVHLQRNVEVRIDGDWVGNLVQDLELEVSPP